MGTTEIVGADTEAAKAKAETETEPAEPLDPNPQHLTVEEVFKILNITVKKVA